MICVLSACPKVGSRIARAPIQHGLTRRSSSTSKRSSTLGAARFYSCATAGVRRLKSWQWKKAGFGIQTNKHNSLEVNEMAKGSGNAIGAGRSRSRINRTMTTAGRTGASRTGAGRVARILRGQSDFAYRQSYASGRMTRGIGRRGNFYPRIPF